MVRSVERIERDIAELERAAGAIAEELQRTYSSYLAALGLGVRQQLILASYHICTQGYPEPFLGLSLQGRQELQRNIRQLAGGANNQLQAMLSVSLAAIVQSQGDPDESNSSSAMASGIAGLFNKLLTDPERLSRWLEKLEEGIVEVLQTVSRDTNRLLQQSGILPRKLPELFLEAAAKIPSSEAVSGPPNLLNLTIETENSEETEARSANNGGVGSSPMHIIAIHLRLSDIEFADSSVMAGRNQIRNLSSRLSSLKREYYKKQRERAVAEAEAAWRACWFEE